jgi:hypothetical protein
LTLRSQHSKGVRRDSLLVICKSFRFVVNQWTRSRLVTAALAASALCVVETSVAESTTMPDSSLTPITLSSQLSQVAPQYVATDTTPFAIVQERNKFTTGGYRFRLFQALPERLWFNVSVEASQRLDTNVYLSQQNQRSGLVERITPNVIVGYNIFKNTSVYANYFALKDRSDQPGSLAFPGMQSLSWGLRHNQQLTRKTGLQLDLQARELWQIPNVPLFDFIPGVTVTHAITANSMCFANAILQMRGRQYFIAPTAQLDPYYTVGYSYRHGLWNLISSSTLVTNFGKMPSNFPSSYFLSNQSSASLITDLEVNHPVKRSYPGLLAFARAEQIWSSPLGLAPSRSGSAFRLYTGLRLVLSKPSYYGAMDNLRKSILSAKDSPPPGTVDSNGLPGNAQVSSKADIQEKPFSSSSPGGSQSEPICATDGSVSLGSDRMTGNGAVINSANGINLAYGH